MSSVVEESPSQGGKRLNPNTELDFNPNNNTNTGTTNNNKGFVPNMEVREQLQNLSTATGPTVSSVSVTVIPPVLQISQPPDQEECDSSTSEYESFPDTASEHEDLEVENTTSKTFDESTSNVKPNVGSSSSVTNTGSLKCDSDSTTNETENTDVRKDWIQPESELQDKVIKQVEFYFSDANITKDAFLLKHVRRNKHGFVSIKLISSFKKIRKLTKDWKAVSFSLQSSVHLELNPEGTKVRRKKPLPEIDLSAPLRTVVVVNLHEDDLSVERVKDMFEHCGDVTLVRIVQPNKPFPPDVLKYIESHIGIRDKVVGLVEFEKLEAAQKAVKTMNSEYDWRSGLSVTLLVKVQSKKKGKEKHRDRERPEQGHLSGGDAESEKTKTRKKKKNKSKNRIDALSHDGGRSVTPSSSDCENSPSPNRRHTNKPIPIPNSHHLSPSGTPKSSPCQSPHGSPRGQRKFHGGRSSHVGSPHSGSPSSRGAYRGSASPHGSPELRRKVYEKSDKEGHSDSSNSPSPWFQRRRLLAAQAKDASPGSSPMLTRRMINPGSGAKPHMLGRDGVLRTPHGPEQSKGFYDGKGRGGPVVM